MRHSLQGLLDVERAEQSSGVGQEQRTAQQALAIGDVSDAPYAAGNRVTDPLRSRIAFEDPAVLEANHVEALLIAVCVDFSEALEESLFVLEPVEHGCEELDVVDAL